ncbi:MAG: GNAT family N-acetyltransferase [Rubrivivax sp.]|jgi:RimJ/RimL family protein N-acetyltransferase
MIEGRLTALRAIEEGDLAQLLAWRNRPELRRYFREYRELNPTQQRQWFDSKVNGDPSTRMFAIVQKTGPQAGRLLGAAGLCYIDWVNRTADFSIYIGADGLYIDDHLAPDAAITMATYGFDELGLNRLWSEIYSFDTPKTAFFQRLGFSLDGRHRATHWAEGAWHDSLYFSLLASDPRPSYPTQPTA